MYDDHTMPHGSSTTSQVALFLIWLTAIFVGCVLYIFDSLRLPSPKVGPIDDETCSKENRQVEVVDGLRSESQEQLPLETVLTVDREDGYLAAVRSNTNDVEGFSNQETRNGTITTGHTVTTATSTMTSTWEPPQFGEAAGASPASSRASTRQHSPVPQGPISRPSPAPTQERLLQNIVVFGCLMAFFIIADYKKVLPSGDRVYKTDVFLFLIFAVWVIAFFYTIKTNPDKLLNRNQTEEWRGWMQMMFVWYHYFSARPWYNWIRVYIAAYVWMTGFGNFSFFWLRQDYSLWRVLKMLFRLNFLVVMICITVQNGYMLYYICPMHTYWFLSVYAFMAVFRSWNTHRYKMLVKFVAYATFNAIIFEVPGLSVILFRPLKFILGIDYPNQDPMHEWSFRSGLDHWSCFIGMLCAYNYPYYEALLSYLESNSQRWQEAYAKIAGRVGLAISAFLLFLIWWKNVLFMGELTYNSVHPYTSWMPIIAFVVLRNIHPILRTHHLGLFAALGKVTLETYLSQFHIYLQSNAKELIMYLPNYPLLTLAAATLLFLPTSFQLFRLTHEFSSWLLPNNYKDISRRVLAVFGVYGVAFVVAHVFRSTAAV